MHNDMMGKKAQTLMLGLLASAGGGMDDVADTAVDEARVCLARVLCQAAAHTFEADGTVGIDPDRFSACRLPDNGAALFRLLASVLAAQARMVERSEKLKVMSKDAGHFTFGDQQDFDGGLQNILGMPVGLNNDQWEASIQREHCDVDPGQPNSEVWGASDKSWKTGNYHRAIHPQPRVLHTSMKPNLILDG